MLASPGAEPCEKADPSVNSYRSPFRRTSTAEEVTKNVNLSGRTALVTGCNAGIGYESMRVMAMRGANICGLARNLDKATEACSKINDLGMKGKATPFACEHTDFDSIVECSDAVRRAADRIDILICNAAVYLLPDLQLDYGIERHFVVNHLAHFILVNRLLDKVLAAQQGRIVIVGSDAYAWAPSVGIDFDNLSGQKHYEPEEMYGQSKLANGLFARELTRRLCHSRATANVANPGWTMTNTMHNVAVRLNMDAKQFGKAKTPEQGAATPCYVATQPLLARVSGQYFEDCQTVIPSLAMRDDSMARRLWDVSGMLTAEYLKPHLTRVAPVPD